jgi:hypothetical protein
VDRRVGGSDATLPRQGQDKPLAANGALSIVINNDILLIFDIRCTNTAPSSTRLEGSEARLPWQGQDKPLAANGALPTHRFKRFSFI